jgi:hypothetical protein
MIDWWGVFVNLMWIAGLAICLAALSMASYRARVTQVRIGQLLAEPKTLCALSGGMMLFCLGLLLSQTALWQRIVFGLLSALFASQTALYWRQVRRSDRPGHGPGEKRSGDGVPHKGRPGRSNYE